MEPKRDERSYGGYRGSQCSCSRGCYTRHARDETQPRLQGGQPVMSDKTFTESVDVKERFLHVLCFAVRGCVFRMVLFLKQYKLSKLCFFFHLCKMSGIFRNAVYFQTAVENTISNRSYS